MTNATPWGGAGNRYTHMGRNGEDTANTDPIQKGTDTTDAHPDLVNPPDLQERYTWSIYMDCKNSVPEGKVPGIDNNPNEAIQSMPDSFH